MRSVNFQAHDVVGIGNALVDVLSHEDDEFLGRFSMDKGAMALIDTGRAEEIYAAMQSDREMSGGSAANTLAGIASFGGRAAFIGRVSHDDLGRVFQHDMSALGVDFVSLPNDSGEPTGRCLIIVTPDAQRTMNTYLGAAADMSIAELVPDTIAAAKVTYLEGYLFDRDPAREAFHEAARIAHSAGGEVATTLSDSFCVTRHQDEWLRLIDDGTDILFANEAEITTLFATDSFEDAAAGVRGKVKIACLTRSEKGSVILHGDETYEIPAVPVPEVVDTTGAGDLYAAGFLHGYTQGMDLARCGELGSIAAGAVIGHTGARPGESLAQLIA
jgi:sugar/nucleoside kinase (ribokinase family)